MICGAGYITVQKKASPSLFRRVRAWQRRSSYKNLVAHDMAATYDFFLPVRQTVSTLTSPPKIQLPISRSSKR